ATDDEKVMMAELYIQWGVVEEASVSLDNLLSKLHDENELKIMFANIYIENNKEEKEIQLLNEITEIDDIYIQAIFQLADLYQAQGLYEVAEQKLLTAKQIVSKEEVIDFALGELYFSIGEYAKAINFYNHVKIELIADISLDERLAEANASIGNYEKALGYYEKIDIENPDVLFKYGFTASQAGRNDIAIH